MVEDLPSSPRVYKFCESGDLLLANTYYTSCHTYARQMLLAQKAIVKVSIANPIVHSRDESQVPFVNLFEQVKVPY